MFEFRCGVATPASHVLPTDVTVALTGINGIGAEFFFNAEKLIILRKTLGATRCTGLYLTSGQPDREVSNVRVFSLTRAM
mmetsp:Transcript_43142/g.103411  ORF Transcript_43142/g.103411 Transcript_43142/m.103411 type:complete len:80 (+) Transcript_43142:67-306(+)